MSPLQGFTLKRHGVNVPAAHATSYAMPPLRGWHPFRPRKALIISAVAKGGVLEDERPPFTRQEVAFRKSKGHLSQNRRTLVGCEMVANRLRMAANYLSKRRQNVY